VIAEQHLALTETFHSPWHFPDAKVPHDPSADFVGEIFLHCNAKEIVERCAEATRAIMQKAYGPSHQLPEIKIEGHLDATFPYILSHLEYIIGELLRNSIQAVIEQRQTNDAKPPPIQILICETSQHVIIRISDQGGGVSREILPYLWSFSKGPRKDFRLKNLYRVPKMAATMQEVNADHEDAGKHFSSASSRGDNGDIRDSSLSSLTSRPPNLRLGIGMPMSRIYAEYWAGSLEIHSLEGYGVDAFLQISKLGNKNEQLTTRASMDAV
jgi:pyruvate dehydrogenase kinase 2/3/4